MPCHWLKPAAHAPNKQRKQVLNRMHEPNKIIQQAAFLNSNPCNMQLIFLSHITFLPGCIVSDWVNRFVSQCHRSGNLTFLLLLTSTSSFLLFELWEMRPKGRKNYSLKKKKKINFPFLTSLTGQANASIKQRKQWEMTQEVERTSEGHVFQQQLSVRSGRLYQATTFPKSKTAAVFISKGLLSSTRTKRTRDRTALEL